MPPDAGGAGGAGREGRKCPSVGTVAGVLGGNARFTMVSRGSSPTKFTKVRYPLAAGEGICYNTRSFLTNAVLATGGESSGGIARCRR